MIRRHVRVSHLYDELLCCYCMTYLNFQHVVANSQSETAVLSTMEITKLCHQHTPKYSQAYYQSCIECVSLQYNITFLWCNDWTNSGTTLHLAIRNCETFRYNTIPFNTHFLATIPISWQFIHWTNMVVMMMKIHQFLIGSYSVIARTHTYRRT